MSDLEADAAEVIDLLTQQIASLAREHAIVAATLTAARRRIEQLEQADR